MTSKGREAVEKAIIRKGFLPYLSLQLPIIGACKTETEERSRKYSHQPTFADVVEQKLNIACDFGEYSTAIIPVLLISDNFELR